MIGSKKKERIRIFQPLIFNGGKTLAVRFLGNQPEASASPPADSRLVASAVMILSQLYFAKVSEFGGDYFLGGGPNKPKIRYLFWWWFRRFFFSIFSLDKMIKNWRAYFSNDLKPPTKHRVFSQTCKSLVEIWAMKQRAPELFRLYMGMNSCPVIWAVFRGKNGSFPQVFADLTFLTSMYNQWTLQRHQRMTQTRSALESMNIPKTLIQWLWLIFVSEIYWWMIFDHPYFDGSCRKLEAKKIPVLNWRMLMIRLYYTSIDPR